MPARNVLVRSALVAAGSLCVALGVVGAFLPLVPTTPFLLLAAACYARSSPRLLRWLNDNRLFGEYIRNWRAGRGIPRREKIIAITLIWLTIGSSVIWFITLPWVEVLLIVIAAAVTMHLIWMPTYRRQPRASDKAMS